MKDILKELDKIEQEIKSAKFDRSRAEGAIEQMMKGIEKTFGVTTKEQIKDKISELAEELDSVGTQIETKFEDLQENYSWE
ncbi:MAG: hypothetical protein AM326_01775 [Candidatus Thorarchaeota archaeon SMTZ-45]|nr:MAG: hypothetical protein AM326_01775 [Candidatus Thorarchaeota archaeon SMTZ-45]